MPSPSPNALLRSLAACALALGGGCGAGPAPERPPNVLLILADDLVAGALGFEGGPDARTPNLDRLANEGVRFTRAYVPLPQCTPSRASLLLGLYPHATGALTNHSPWRTELAPLPELLRASGYRCGIVGKWHLGEPDQPAAGFEDSWCVIDTSTVAYGDPVLWVQGRPEPRAGYVPTLLTDEAIRFIDAGGDDAERPFFLWLAYTSPHEPLVPPPDPELAPRPRAVTLPASFADDLAGKPRAQRESETHALFRRRTPDELRYVYALYQSVVNALDREIGRLLAHLDERGLARDTLVVFLSDNGTLRGEHQQIGKGPAFYEELVRMPLVLRWPGRLEPGREVAGLVSSMDLYPTLARLAGATTPNDVHGLDLWPMALGQAERVRDELYFEYLQRQPDESPTPMLGIVTERYKYVQYFDGEEELYDLAADPSELANLARAPGAAPLDDLRRRVEGFRESAGLRGR